MSGIRAIKKTIDHWNRMIAWMRTRPVGERPNGVAMIRAIGEGWYATHCALCAEATKKHGITSARCAFCCLGPTACCDEWYRVADMSESAGAWVAHAELMVQRLKRELRFAKARRRRKCLRKRSR
jgi:hypothetical protein